MEIFSRYNVCSTLLTLSHRREQRKQRRASIDTEVGTNYAFKHYPMNTGSTVKLPTFFFVTGTFLQSVQLVTCANEQ